jgi:hypothetical protein
MRGKMSVEHRKALKECTRTHIHDVQILFSDRDLGLRHKRKTGEAQVSKPDVLEHLKRTCIDDAQVAATGGSNRGATWCACQMIDVDIRMLQRYGMADGT